MSIYELDQENADFNIATVKTVLTDTPDANLPMVCMGMIKLGDGTKNLNGSGGEFTITVSVGGQTIQGVDTITFGTEARAAVYTEEFVVPPGDEVLLKVTSPNAGDTDVDITAYLYAVGGDTPAILGKVSNGTNRFTRVSLDGFTPIADDVLVGALMIFETPSDLRGIARPISTYTDGVGGGEDHEARFDIPFPGSPSVDDDLIIVKRS